MVSFRYLVFEIVPGWFLSLIETAPALLPECYWQAGIPAKEAFACEHPANEQFLPFIRVAPGYQRF